MENGRATLQEILGLFICLEMGAMVGIYFKTNRLPVPYLLYIGITALARSFVVNAEAEKSHVLLVVTGAILVLALAIVALGYGTSNFVGEDEDARDRQAKTD